jgi:methionyl-tRNA formyltransferase
MRVILLTTGGDYGRWIADGLAERNVRLESIVLDLYRPRLKVALRRPRRVVGPFRRWHAARSLSKHAPLVVVGNLNDRRSTEMLRALEPDLLVLAGARILSREVLETATFGALNAHPARLPGFRGTGVVGWSILRGVPVTVTVHLASPEVDAGDVVRRTLVPVEPADTLAEIEARASRLCADALVEVAAAVVRGEEIPREPQEADPEILRWLDPEQRARAEERVRAGEAVRLYHAAAGD